MRPRLLVVDDNRDTIDILGALLEDAGYAVSAAADGVEAFVRLRWDDRPAAILLDLWLPVVSGADVLEQLRREPSLAGIPVVVLTAAPVPAEVERGADAVLQKPFNLATLLRVLASLLARREASSGASA